MMKPLCDLSELRDTRFGQPYPRHGLSLLWWFADECVDIGGSGRMIARYNPAYGDFGFERFRNAERLLPNTTLPYYEVGNLRKHNQRSLPHHVTKNYDPDILASNTDRIIASVGSSQNGQVWFDQIYVTQHSDRTRFDQNRTYCISQSLIEDIKNLRPADFLTQMTSDQNSQFIQIESPDESTYEPQWSHHSAGDNCDCATCCTVLGCALLVFLIVIVLIYTLLM